MHNTVSKKTPRNPLSSWNARNSQNCLPRLKKRSPRELSDQEIVALFGLTDPEDCRMLKDAAFRRTTALLMGPYVYYRGLIELSNICTANCRYCGIRKANHDVKALHNDQRGNCGSCGLGC